MIVSNIEELRDECKDVSLIEATGIITRLEGVLAENPGIGIAANQIGIDGKVCLIRTRNKINLVNPIITDMYDIMEFENEGCLSFKGIRLLTKRYNEVVIKDSIHPAGIILVGLDAVVAQHEIDHLYGRVMFDYEIKRPQVNQLCWCNSKKKYKKCHSGKKIKINV